MTHVAYALLFGWATVTIGLAQSPSETAAQLAARISSQLPRRPTVSLELQNLSSLTPADVSSFRNALEDELRKAGLPMTATQPETRVRVTISDNNRGLLLVEEMFSGENRTIIMQPWISPPSSEAKPYMRISRRPVWTQSQPVLDLLLFNSDSEILVLSPTAVSSFHIADSKWVLTSVATLTLARPPARDPRGRIENSPGGIRVYLPGTTCRGTLQPMLSIACVPGNEAWPVNPHDPGIVARWVTDQNLMQSDGVAGVFYTGANGWFSTADHRIIDRAAGGSPIMAEAWGSDFAGIESSCSTNPTVLVSGQGDGSDHDQVRAYEIASGRPTPVSEPTTLPGPVTALWPAEIPGQATLVVRNSKTGNYEASRLGVACAE